MEVIFLIGTIQAVFLAVLMFLKKDKMLADKIMAIWLLFMGLHLLSYYMHVTDVSKNYPVFNVFSVNFPMLEGAFTYLYVSVITNKIQKLNWKDLIHASHYIIFTAISFYYVLSFDNLSMSEVIENIDQNPNLFFEVMGLFNIFLGPVYMLFCLYLLRKHKLNIENDFSYTEKIDLLWLKYVVIAMVVVWISVITVHIIGEIFITLQEGHLGDDIIYTMVTLAVFFYGFFGIKQQVIYLAPSTGSSKKKNVSEVGVEDVSGGQYQKSGLKKEESEKHLEQLLLYMDEEAPYLDGKLSLKQVALKLDITTNYLSQVINENLQKNFFDFVNEYRVKVFKEKMNDQENKQFTLLSIAYDCGFNSKSSFNSIFKKFTGLTPTEYQKAS